MTSNCGWTCVIACARRYLAVNRIDWNFVWNSSLQRTWSSRMPLGSYHQAFCWLNASRNCAFSALTLLVIRQEEHLACKNWVTRCWWRYLSGARCRLFAYGPADTTAIPKPHHLLPHFNPDWFYLSGTCLPRLWLNLLGRHELAYINMTS